MKTYLTETTLGIVAALLLSSAAFAGPFGLPDHQPDGYRDTGCEIDQQVQITNDAGEYLYSNNPTCPDVGGAGNGEFFAFYASTLPDSEEEPVDPVDPEPEEPCKSCAPETE